MTFRWKKRAGMSVLGLSIERDRIDVVELRRTNGSSDIRRSATFPLETDPLTLDPVVLGKMLRERLDQAGIRETHCAVALPAHAAMTLALPLPDLPEADQLSFLEIEAERGFPQSPDDLIRQTSLTQGGIGPRHATLLAFERDAIQRLEAGLRAAKLKPATFTLGLASLQPPSATGPEPVLSLLPSGTRLGLQLNAGNGIAVFRSLEDIFVPATETHPAQSDLDLVFREIRITLGQLPGNLGESLRIVNVVGPSDLARVFAAELAPRLESLGLSVRLVPNLKLAGLPFRLPTLAPASPALAVAVHAAAGFRPLFEFLPPRISSWQALVTRYSSRRLAWIGGAASATAAIAAVLFLGQQILLWRWQSRWAAIKPKVSQVESMQREVRRYSPWFDESVRSLSVLRRLSEAFPEDGSVSAKSIEIRGPSQVACSGTAKDPQAWLRMLDNVRAAEGITDVKVEQVRGKGPVEFSFNFRWLGTPGS